MTTVQSLPEAMIFDLDGTLFQTETLLIPVYYRLFDQLRSEGLYEGETPDISLILGSLGMLSKYGGWSRNTVRRGDVITVQGFKAKDGSPYFSVGRIWLPNGLTLEGKP